MKDKEKIIQEIAILINGRTETDTMAYYKSFEKAKKIYDMLLPEDDVVYKDGKIYYNGEHIGYIDFSFYEDIKALGFGNFEIIDKRKGYGTLVIKDIIHKYKDKYNLIYCFVDKENIGAIEFYKKVGKVRIDIVNEKGQYQVILYGKEDSVVLSREQFKILCEDKVEITHLSIDEEFKKECEYEMKQVRKETAEKILKVISDTHTENIGYTDWLDGFFGDKFKKLCEQYGLKAVQTKDGVEIKE